MKKTSTGQGYNFDRSFGEAIDNRNSTDTIRIRMVLKMMKQRKHINDYYSNLSYRGKFRIIFNILLCCIFVFCTAMAVYFANLLTDEIYEKNRERLIFLTNKIENDFTNIEDITTDIHQNSIIQDALVKSADPDVDITTSWNAQVLANSEINWLLSVQKDISKMILLNNEGENVSKTVFNKNDLFNNQSLEEILRGRSGEEKRGRWIFQNDLSQALYIQNIFNVKQMSMEKIGTMILFVNTSFISSLVEEADILSSDDYFYLQDSNGLYSTSSEATRLSQKMIDLVEKQKRNSDELSFVSNNFGKYLVFSKEFETNNSSFRIFYFLKNNQVITKVVSTLILILFILILFVSLSYLLVNRHIDRLIKPINRLVLTMKRFGGENDLKSLQEVDQPLASVIRNDEIGELYSSFHALVSQIEELVIKDYQSKLLAQDMEFKYLQAQLDPHFLYNTLNSINGLAIEEGNFDISEMVTSLAKLLRKRLEVHNRFESVNEELQIVRAYIKIQSVRFSSRLIYEEDVESEVRSLMIPQLIIQPLVENAMKYAVEKVNRPVTIRLSIKRIESNLEIRVVDNGPGFDPNSEVSKKSTGLGMNNIRERIKLIYAEIGSLTITSVADYKTEIVIILPIQEGESEHETI